MRIFAIAAIALGLSACADVSDILDQGRPHAANAAAEAVLALCALPISERQANAEALAAELLGKESAAQVTLDCDGDGLPDF